MNLKKRVIFSIIPGLFLLLACSGPEKKIEKKPTEAEILQAFQIPESSYDELPKERKLFAAHYPISNEMRIDLFMKPIENIGGGYIGVGTDQNLSFIAKARSEFAYLMDFDPVIVRVNKIHILFLKTAPTYPEFLKLWSFSNNKASYELIKKEFEAGSDFNLINQAWKIAATKVGVPSRLKDLNYMTKRFGLQSFHNVEKEYAYLHELAKKGRIQAIPGDLTGKKTMQAISLSAKKLNIPIRILYTSNAEEYTKFPQGFRDNILSLPVDEKSVLLRTITSFTKGIFGFPEGEGERFPDYPFHYNLHPLQNFKKWMGYKSKISFRNLLNGRTKLEKGFSIQKASPEEAGVKESGDINKYAK